MLAGWLQAYLGPRLAGLLYIETHWNQLCLLSLLRVRKASDICIQALHRLLEHSRQVNSNGDESTLAVVI